MRIWKQLKILILVISCLSISQNIDAQQKKKNLLFIITDQQRYDALSKAGNTVLQTPNLDRLAQQGSYFKNAYTPMAVCGPTRASILTGATIEHTGVNTNEKTYDYQEEGLMTMPTFDEILTENGYRCEYYGKWHTLTSHAAIYKNPVLTAQNGNSVFGSGGQSFIWRDELNTLGQAPPPGDGEFIDGLSRWPYVADPLDKYYGMTHQQLQDQNLKHAQPDQHGKLLLDKAYTITAFQAKQTLEAIERLKDETFSITCSFHFPHSPMVLPEPYYSMYPVEDMIVPESISDDMQNSPYLSSNGRLNNSEYADAEKIKYMISNYYGLLSEVDDWVGKILDKVDELGLTDNTLIIFTSDHGEMLGSHGMREKNVFYEESAHIPLFISSPGDIEAGKTVDGYISLIDLFPTILDYLEVPEKQSDGKSLRGLIEGTDTEHGQYVVTEWNTSGDKDPNYMIVKNGWKLLIPFSITSTVINAMYDLNNDPFEINNLLGSNPNRAQYQDKAEELRASLLEWLAKNKSAHYYSVSKRDLLNGGGPTGNNASFVSQDLPELNPGEKVTVSVTMKNTGTSTWQVDRNFKLGSQSPVDNRLWGLDRVNLSVDDSIEPNSEKTFTFEIVVPNSDGIYNFQWQMVQEGEEWFGSKSTIQQFILGDPGSYLDVCDDISDWKSSADLLFNTIDKQQGTGCIEFNGSSADEFKRVFSTSYKSNSTESETVLKFWYYISDPSKIGSSNQVEIGSGGKADSNEYNWKLEGLSAGWNFIQLNTSEAGKIGTPNLNAINWFRIYSNKSGNVTTRIDAIQLIGAQSLSIDKTSLNNKIMAGYQGWFNAPGSGNEYGWIHWSNGSGETPSAENITIDMWPDLREFDEDELFPTNFVYQDGSNAGLYSAYTTKTVDRHLKWMKDYGIDGVFVQRFISSALSRRDHRDQVLQNVRLGAEAHGRVFANMYDMSGGVPATFVQDVIDDWKHLVDDLKILESPNYLHHKGRPLLSLWGVNVGGSKDILSAAHWAALVKWFTVDAPEKYKVTLKAGVGNGWRQDSSDWQAVYDAFEVISPWAPGRYSDNNSADTYRNTYFQADLDDTASRGMEYMPVVFPGFSWKNLKGENTVLNAIPRNGGEFLWHQMYNAIDAGCEMIYVAMFDEVDEGTAIFKITENASQTPTTGEFVTLDIDGQELPSDWYLKLTGEASKMLRGEVGLTDEIPISPYPNSSKFISQELPTIVASVASESVSITMKNTGTTNWTKNDGYKLGSIDPIDNITWGTNRIEMEDGETITPGQSKIFTFNITAPVSENTYRFQWKMIQEGNGWFGEKSKNRLVTVGNTSRFLDDCDAATAWSSSGSLSLNSTDKKQGENCLQYSGSSTSEFQKVFATPYNSGISENDAVLQFWYYTSDASKMGSSNQVEIGSNGTNDQNEYSWTLKNLKTGWNLITLRINEASKNGEPDLNAINWFRLYNNKLGTVITRIDEIQILDYNASSPKYDLIVNNGTGDGNYIENTTVEISAEEAPAGYIFKEWVINSGNPIITKKETLNTSLKTVAEDMIITATYKLLGIYLDDCDNLIDWKSSSSLSLNSTDNKEGINCIEFNGSATDEFKKVFSTPYKSNGTEVGTVVSFWYYVSDPTLFESSNQVEIGSSGKPDTDEYSWNLSGLVAGWNFVELHVKDASKNGNPDLSAINWFRLYRSKSGNVITRIDAIKLNDPNAIDPAEDSDGDGVHNDVDLCSNTVSGATVNEWGCLMIPSNNFSVKAISESCENKNNGSIEINAVKTFNYTVTVNDVDTYNFTNNFMINNLVPGEYSICISIAEETSYMQCFDLTINKAQKLSGKSIRNKKSTLITEHIQITSGTAPYTIFVNDEERQSTDLTNFDIDVNQGDKIKITSKLPCEGSINMNIDMFSVYPNPTINWVDVQIFDANLKEVVAEVYNALQQKISQKNYKIVNGKIRINLNDSPPGVYFIILNLETPVSVKIMKQ